MNKTTNQYINQLNLDPKKEAAVRKLVENAGGVNDSTPLVENLVGNELLPIKQDGENKAVRADELVKGGKEVFIITPDMFEQTTTVSESPYPSLTFTDDGLNKFKEAVEANKIIGINKSVFSFIENKARPFTAGIGIEPGNYVFSTYVGVMKYGYALSFEILNTVTADIDRYEVSIVSKVFSYEKNMSADGSFYLEPSMFVEPAASEPIPGLELMEVYKEALYRAIDANKIIKIEYNVLGYLDMIATPYAIAQAEGYFILDNIIKLSDISFQATVILPETNYHLTINYNNGIFTANTVDMSNTYIWDGSTSETIFDELNEACVAKRRIILVNDDKYIVFSSFRTTGNNLILIGYPESFGVTSTEVIEITTYKEIDISGQISANKYVQISVTSDIDITYNENVVPIQTPVFEGELFFSGTVYNVTFPDDIKWSTDSVLDYKANHTYQFRIVNNLGVMKEFANS